ncbi:DnaD domain-containing protein [Paenisporosarcina cavernae]|uniref:DnaD domain protein n=1 Tax=Paenisporosarcina cavernae TaxID=2320858 RepID=A0A385YU09_9BACL|nr:DnaD domain-containing protein [Paenisporosarcina cavernae]AYC29417.1 DnaD domain protein [Paenisporosarcina cavernae]
MENQLPDRLQAWLEQGNVTISQLFFKHYKTCGIQDHEALLLLHLIAFKEQGVAFPTPKNLAEVTHFTEQQISQYTQRLFQKGFLSIENRYDANGVYEEMYSFHALWAKLLESLEQAKTMSAQSETTMQEGELYKIFEQEFGRLLSPMEMESIGMWLDHDKMSPELIKAALKEAVIAQKVSLRYIDRILFEWKKKNIQTPKQVEKHASEYRAKTIQPTSNLQQPTTRRKVPFYNWLEERD